MEPRRPYDETENPETEEQLTRLLETNGHRFAFFQVVRILEHLNPGAAPIGERGPLVNEAVRFRHDPSLGFPAGDVSKVRPRVARHGLVFAEVTSTFLGLFGANSPLPTTMSEDVLKNEDDSGSLRAFYDIFHHRLISLFYRAWKKTRMYASHRADGSDRLTQRVLSFVGVDGFGATPNLGIPPIDLLALAPLLAVRTRSARTLETVLTRVFPGIAVGVESFLERRVMLSDDQRAQLGLRNGTLGTNFTIGRSVVDRTGRFGVQVGPVDYELFEALLPGGKHHTKLREVVQQFTRGVLEAEVELLLKDDQTPRFQLGERGAQLGVTTTLRSAEGKALKAKFVLSDNAEEARATMS
ncbi:MAG: type VI secretion system baseplate subunit TssG [Myxococcales bacterium]|nr:type VI secretion system baseplate subunit TssG [Myxococcales bacterium]